MKLKIRILSYFRIGYPGKIRKYISKHNLKPSHNSENVMAEWLRQNFLIDYPEERENDLQAFIENTSTILEYSNGGEDGYFIINKESGLLKKETPITNEEYNKTKYPEGWDQYDLMCEENPLYHQ